VSNSNYNPTGTPSNLSAVIGAVNTPVAGSPDAKLLQRQMQYWGLCSAYISAASANRNGVDFTNQRQTALLNIQNSTYMTSAQANAYFPGTTAAFWANNVIDYFAALTAMQNSTF
jgi:hypothetical protein